MAGLIYYMVLKQEITSLLYETHSGLHDEFQAVIIKYISSNVNGISTYN